MTAPTHFAEPVSPVMLVVSIELVAVSIIKTNVESYGTQYIFLFLARTAPENLDAPAMLVMVDVSTSFSGYPL